MSSVKAKKSLGQHFLNDQNIANKIVNSLESDDSSVMLEIGPGTGVLTKLLVNIHKNFFAIDIDKRMTELLAEILPDFKENIIHANVISYDFKKFNSSSVSVIGNLPYFLSSQIFFKVLENRDIVKQAVFMIQKEVAERIASKKGSKVYGILSVLLQAFYNIELLFIVNETSFVPPPKVKSAVIKLTRNERKDLGCDEILFFKVVKVSFNQRRKMLSNSLKSLLNNMKINDVIMNKRPEQLSVDEFVYLTNLVEGKQPQTLEKGL
jgi:16S rRNA (adenine1518-N6/adenine1519-N6)-dimethyltransferase